MCSDGYKSSVSSKVRMQLILEGNERLVSSFRELYTPENRSSSIRPNTHSLTIKQVRRKSYARQNCESL